MRLKAKEIYLIIGIVLLSIAIISDLTFDKFLIQVKKDYVRNKIQSKVFELESNSDNLVKEFRQNFGDVSFLNKEKAIQKSEESNIILFEYVGDELHFYSSNSVIPKYIYEKTLKLEKLSKGYYLQKNYIYGDTTILSLIPIQFNYKIENKILVTNFIYAENGKEDYKISQIKQNGFWKIIGKNGTEIFYLDYKTMAVNQYWISILFLIGFVFFNFYIYLQVQNYIKKGEFLNSTIVYFIYVIFITFLWNILKIPSNLFSYDLFSPKIYASSIVIPLSFISGKDLIFSINSIGDLFIITYLIWITSRYVRKIRLLNAIEIPHNIRIVLFSIFITLLCVLCEAIASSLLKDSNIIFSAEKVLDYNIFTLISFLIFLFWAEIIINFIISFCRTIEKRFQWFLGFIVILLFLLAIVFYYSGFSFYFGIGLSSLLFFFMNLNYNIRKGSFIVFKIGLLLILCIFFGIIIFSQIEKKNLELAKVTANNIVYERDPIAEFLLPDILKQIANDPNLDYLFSGIESDSSDKLYDNVKQQYFSGYFSKYQIGISFYKSKNKHFLKPDSIIINKFIKQMDSINYVKIEEDGKPSYYYQNNLGRSNYYSYFIQENDSGEAKMTIVSLNQKSFFMESLYPELAISDKLSNLTNLKKYSFALYHNNKLNNQNGECPFPMNMKFSSSKQNEPISFKGKIYQFLFINFSANDSIIICYKNIDYLTFTSYLSLLIVFFFGIKVLAKINHFLFENLITNGFKYKQIGVFFVNLYRSADYKTKIVASFFVVITICFGLIGSSTIQYFVIKYNKDKEDDLKRVALNISKDLGENLKDQKDNILINKNSLNGIVNNLSHTYQKDLHVYNQRGNLTSSSQNIIFEKGIQERKINPKPYYEIFENNENVTIVKEKIGNLIFYSCYAPIRNFKNKIIGFLNIPVFDTNKEVETSVGNFLVSMIQIYIFLFIVIMIFTSLLGNILTAPLSIIIQQMKALKLSGNKRINYNGKDEFKELVDEYNSMIVNLERSASKLVISEREGAWQEMARQVAHEIKNPLTPMRLQMQRLQMAASNHLKKDQLPEMISKVSAIIVKQIDILTDIASDFTNFAKFTQQNPEEVEVKISIREVVDLFSADLDSDINFLSTLENPICMIDKSGFERSITNVIKNGIQAVSEGRRPNIFIRIIPDKFAEKVTITISDNGKGIPQELSERIFTPNFSTKTSGMGLGLAIVRSIVENAGGKITFKTEIGEGTTFFITLPAIFKN